MDNKEYQELDKKFTQLEKSMEDIDMPFMMSFGTDLCIDGHFTKEQLVILANKILEVFGNEGD